MTHSVNAYAALGGHPGIRRAVEQFARFVLGDPMVAGHFAAPDPGAWRRHQLEVLAAAVGGPQRNSAATGASGPGTQLSDAEFTRVLDHLTAALIEVGADEEAIRDLITATSENPDLIVVAIVAEASPLTSGKDTI